MSSSKKRIVKKVYKVGENFREKFNLNKPKEKGLTKIEQYAGFSEETRIGNRVFCNTFGQYIEAVFQCGDTYQKHSTDSIDLVSDIRAIQVKSKHNTIKCSDKILEAKEWLKYSVRNNREFALLVIEDKKCQSRDVPLHEGLTGRVVEIEGYDPKKHRMVSWSKAYEMVFPEIGKLIEKMVETYIKSLRLTGIRD
jgi:hypothetical protein